MTLETNIIQTTKRGNWQRLIRLLPSTTTNAQLYNHTNHESQQTLLHAVLQAQFHKFNHGQKSTAKDFNVYKTILKRIAKHIDASEYCPIVDAIHYRFHTSVNILLAAMSSEQISDCLQERDINGDTVLHVVSKSKAAGFARHLLTHRRDSSRNNREVGVHTLTDVDATATFRQLNHPATINHHDLEVLLQAGRDNNMDLHSWLSSRNKFGETPLMVGCRAGREEVVRKFLEVSSRTAGSWSMGDLQFETHYNMTCAHVAAVHGHLTVLKLIQEKRSVGRIQVMEDGSERLLEEENDAKTDVFGRTVVQVACQSARENIVLYLHQLAVNKTQFVNICLAAASNVTSGENAKLACLLGQGCASTTTKKMQASEVQLDGGWDIGVADSTQVSGSTKLKGGECRTKLVLKYLFLTSFSNNYSLSLSLFSFVASENRPTFDRLHRTQRRATRVCA